jgi:hypothetical protein
LRVIVRLRSQAGPSLKPHQSGRMMRRGERHGGHFWR